MGNSTPPRRAKRSSLKRKSENRLLKFFHSLIVCLLFVSFADNTFAQFDTQAFIQSEIEKQKARLNSSDAEERRDAVLRLGWIKTPESSRAAVAALNDSADIVRASATHAILSLPSDEAANYLLPLLDDKIELVRQEAAYALGKTQNQNAVAKLLSVLNNKKEFPSVRGAAAVALGMIGDSSANTSLILALQEKKKPNAFVRRAAAHSLGQTHGNEASSILITILSDEKEEPDVRREAAWALGALREVSAIAALKTATNSNDPQLSEQARQSLKNIILEK